MKLTLEHYDMKVEVSTKADDLSITDVRDLLLVPLLVAAGFHIDNVNELFDLTEPKPLEIDN